MADIASLFGLTPEGLAQQRYQQDLKQGYELAQLDPGAAARAGIQAGVGQLGRGIAGLMGVQDPQMQQISQQAQLLRSIDMTDPKSIIRGAQLATQMGNVQAAQALASQAQAVMKAQAETQKIGAEATKIDMENIGKQSAIQQLQSEFGMDKIQATTVASNPELLKNYLTPKTQQGLKLLETGKYTPESVNSWVNGGELEAIDKTAKPPADWAAKARELGLPVAASFGSYTPEQVAAVNKAVFNDEIAKKAAGAAVTRVSITQKQPEAFETNLGAGQAKMVLENKAAAQEAASILETNIVAKNLLKSGVITGTGANFLVGLNNALKQAGIDFGYADAAANSQAYMAAMGANVGRLVKQFGSGTAISNSDREYAEKIAGGQISLTEDALRKIIDINDRAANRVIDLHNKNVKDIKTNIPLTVEKPTMMQTPKSAVEQIPSQQGALSAPMYARNPETNERIMSLDGGKTWKPAR